MPNYKLFIFAFLSFQIEEERFGATTTTELKSDGANIPVTNENKMEYIDLIINHRYFQFRCY